MSDGKQGAESTLRDLCSNLSAGLHAAAQPLAILRASLGSVSADRMNLEELRQLSADWATEVERVCALFSCLQQFVNLETASPQYSLVSILPLLAEAAEGVELLFEEDGMTLCSSMPEQCDAVPIDKRRTMQALSAILLTAHSVSQAPDIVELSASAEAQGVRVVVRNTCSRAKAMKTEWSLNMALAEANLRSQNAGFSWSLNPFHAQIDFRKAPLPHYS